MKNISNKTFDTVCRMTIPKVDFLSGFSSKESELSGFSVHRERKMREKILFEYSSHE